jgi:hypothetical protein
MQQRQRGAAESGDKKMKHDPDWINYRWRIAIEMADTCGPPTPVQDLTDPTELSELRSKIVPFTSLGTGDTSQLIKLLLSDLPITREFRDNLADLLKRHTTLKRKKGKQQTPVYRLSPAEAKLKCAADDYYLLRYVQKMGGIQAYGRHLGPNADDALYIVAEDWDIKSNTLADFLNNKRGASRRRR